MLSVVQLVDFANFTPVITEANLTCLKDIGVFGAVPGTQTGDNGNFTASQIAVCRAGGLDVRWDYAWLHWRSPDPTIKFTEGFGLPAWLDVEESLPPGVSHANAVAIIHHAAIELDMACGCVGYYTSGTKWRELTGNHTCDYCASKLLWDAWYPFLGGRYPDAVSLEAMRANINKWFTPYGPWPERSIWQFASEGPCNFNADHNFCKGELVMPADNKPSQDQLRLAIVRGVLQDYDFEILGQNGDDGHWIVKLHNKDGSETNPVVVLPAYV